MPKYEDRRQKIQVTELMCDMLNGIKHYLTEENKQIVAVALNILNNTEVEDKEK